MRTKISIQHASHVRHHIMIIRLMLLPFISLAFASKLFSRFSYFLLFIFLIVVMFLLVSSKQKKNWERKVLLLFLIFLLCFRLILFSFLLLNNFLCMWCVRDDHGFILRMNRLIVSRPETIVVKSSRKKPKTLQDKNEG